jgi:hypothetical protein
MTDDLAAGDGEDVNLFVALGETPGTPPHQNNRGADRPYSRI